ncbi:prolyl aminopeptidase [Candidatus Collierbacteria bacterium CG10_big_fil_rev_8_21_14_0_10_44_9]|uniref:Proline iminopeptidase n=1 Tax=Candidatus Collierbacteria bacterium CG10_big_fil_rev_8_21_14_0_10_44_9 TaxID=1974535 RepID=A0A2H0VIB6_9BACT|nr:MAG: prolyl aminopeptidase [Candidatus Collierbacteria bacterium CG10_big_fil_rev_8_21_14_0_10_44_9]
MISHNPQSFNTDYLPEQDGHKVWFAQYGNPSGIPIVVCHGGPGDKSKPRHINRYDLDKYHVITFDQRGCGQSLPLGETKNNTLSDLVSDMERLCNILKIEKWYIAGGSWGSTVALTYAESFPEKTKGLLLSSIFLARQKDEEWSFTREGGITRIFPDLIEKRSSMTAKDLLNKLESGDEESVKEIVAGVMNWEGNLMTSQADIKLIDIVDVDEENIASARVFLSYQANNYFLELNQIIKNSDRLKNIPTIIVHGRYDLLCPMDNAWELHQHLSNSELVILPSSNHRLTADGEIAKNMAFKYFLSKQS